ncbi:hypothetical protein ACIQVL_03195 [Streptomyces sp. NPDC090499]|uniref:hypothetical protein n=1 Tax=Streptomyces sp. NPDC090499 TaxID=3365965 RepID=UPI0037FE4A1D
MDALTTFPTIATGAQIATAALAGWGVTAFEDGDVDAGTSWLVLGRGEGRPQEDREPYLLIILYASEEADCIMNLPVQRHDTWRLVSGDGTGTEREIVTESARRIDRVAARAAEWLFAPQD